MASSRCFTPHEAFISHLLPTAFRINKISDETALALLKPVEVFTIDAPASTLQLQALLFSKYHRKYFLISKKIHVKFLLATLKLFMISSLLSICHFVVFLHICHFANFFV